MKRLSLVVSLPILIWACGGGSLTSVPTSPSPPPAPAPPRATYILSGTVSEVSPIGQRAIDGVRLEVRGENTTNFLSATTDKNGLYNIPGLYTGSSSLSVSLVGYVTDTKSVTISGDTRLDIQLVPREIYTLSGVVSEMTPTGQVPVEGVLVWEDYFHAPATTDTNGFYRFRGPYGTGLTIPLSFTKEGFQAKTGSVTVNGDTQLDVQLVRR